MFTFTQKKCKIGCISIEMKLCVCYNLFRVTEGGDRMKESAGEANITVITIVLIGLVAAAGAIIIPNLITSMKKKSCCTQAGGTWVGSEDNCRGNGNTAYSVTEYTNCVDAK